MAKRTKKPVQADDVKLLQVMNGITISPGGRHAATVIGCDDPKSFKKQSHIWLCPLPKGQPVQYTCGEHLDFAPRFSPDGRTIAFISNRTGRYQVFLLAIGGGEARQLTDLPGGVWSCCWMPDGTRLIVNASREPAPEDTPVFRRVTGWSVTPLNVPGDLLLVDAASGKTRTLVADGHTNYSPAVSPDGKWVVYVSNHDPDPLEHPLRTDLFKVRTGGKGKPQLIKTHPGPAYSPVISPDGKLVAFQGFADDELGWDRSNIDVCVVPLREGGVRNLSGHLDRTTFPMLLCDTWGHCPHDPVQWTPDGRYIYAVVQEGGATEVHRFAADGTSHSPILRGDGAVLSFAIDFPRELIAAVCSEPDQPNDIYLGPLGGGRCKRLTRTNTWLNRRAPAGFSETLTTARGGPRLQGWVWTPPDFDPAQKYPGILYIHGGPTSSYGRVFMHEFNYLAGAGYIVFGCNPRGGQGYGAEFVGAIHDAWGTMDYDDVMRFTDHVLRRYPAIDRQRLGVAGGSYGGYMTNWIIGHTRRFRAAVTQRTVANFISWAGSGMATGLTAKHHFTAERSAEENFMHLWRMSPAAHLHHAKTPTLVIQGEADSLTPPEQGRQVYGLLKALGVETELLLFPEEGHEMSRAGRLDRRIARLEAIREWFDRYLMN